MYILNERDFIRSVLLTKQKPNDISIEYLIKLIAKYYYSPDINIDELINVVKSKMLEFDIFEYQEHLYINKIKTICAAVCDPESTVRNFKEIEYIPIYKKELDVINTLKLDREKKLMFTLYAVARYRNSYGWTNIKNSSGISELFQLANVTLPSDKRNELLHQLYVNGHIEFSKKIDNLNIHVELLSEGDVAYKIKEFANLGNQYIGNFKYGYKMCAEPGCLKYIKVNGHNTRYCKQCSDEKRVERYKKYNEKR